MRELIKDLDTTSEVCSFALTPCLVSYWILQQNSNSDHDPEKRLGGKTFSKRLLDETSSALWYNKNGALALCFGCEDESLGNSFPKASQNDDLFFFVFQVIFISYFSTIVNIVNHHCFTTHLVGKECLIISFVFQPP